MRMLIVEDDFTSRCLLTELLSPHGRCEIAVNGYEALQAVEAAIRADNAYQVICLDIMMPKMDGRTTLRAIRDLETKVGIWPGPKAAKILMTTGASDSKSILGSFKDQCDAYIVKPITEAKLLETLRKVGLIA